MKKFANLIIEKRVFFLIAILLITGIFLYQAVTKLTVKTSFADLLSAGHPGQ